MYVAPSRAVASSLIFTDHIYRCVLYIQPATSDKHPVSAETNSQNITKIRNNIPQNLEHSEPYKMCIIKVIKAMYK